MRNVKGPVREGKLFFLFEISDVEEAVCEGANIFSGARDSFSDTAASVFQWSGGWTSSSGIR